jgi:phosphohistidine swiveling domain-containing protein
VPSEPIDLDGAGVAVALAGAKAAALGDARRRGLPVLPGFVVPADDGRRLVASFDELSRTRGAHAAALAVMEAAERVDLTGAVEAARRLGPRLVVRSSSPVEGDPVWAGAFSSFLDVEPRELPTAVAGCWASVFTTNVLARCARTGRSPADVCPAVLVQPMVDPGAGGVARTRGAQAKGMRGGRWVDIVGVRGSPAPLLAGWSHGDALPLEWRRAVEDLARRAGDGAPVTLEWAIVAGRPVLLQLRREPGGTECRPGGDLSCDAPADPPSFGPVLGAGGSPLGPAVARAVARFGGPLGDELVLPWVLASLPEAVGAVAAPGALDAAGPGDASVAALLEDFDRTVDAARALVARALGRSSRDARDEAARLLGRVAGGDLAALERARPVPVSDQRGVLGGFHVCARGLRASGALGSEEQLWTLTVEEVRARLRAPRPVGWHAQRLRSWRWQPLIQSVVARWGSTVRGDGAAPGRAAGRGRRVTSGEDLRCVAPGDVVVLDRPFPQAAPALWVASALVAESGSTAAHLVDVARAVRVPAVVAAGRVPVGEAGTLVLVDGDCGDVRLLGP